MAKKKNSNNRAQNRPPEASDPDISATDPNIGNTNKKSKKKQNKKNNARIEDFVRYSPQVQVPILRHHGLESFLRYPPSLPSQQYPVLFGR